MQRTNGRGVARSRINTRGRGRERGVEKMITIKIRIAPETEIITTENDHAAHI